MGPRRCRRPSRRPSPRARTRSGDRREPPLGFGSLHLAQPHATHSEHYVTWPAHARLHKSEPRRPSKTRSGPAARPTQDPLTDPHAPRPEPRSAEGRVRPSEAPTRRSPRCPPAAGPVEREATTQARSPRGGGLPASGSSGSGKASREDPHRQGESELPDRCVLAEYEPAEDRHHDRGSRDDDTAGVPKTRGDGLPSRRTMDVRLGIEVARKT